MQSAAQPITYSDLVPKTVFSLRAVVGSIDKLGLLKKPLSRIYADEGGFWRRGRKTQIGLVGGAPN